jgi:RsiW-degrading membrane proteinase PrsW (M82 family)
MKLLKTLTIAVFILFSTQSFALNLVEMHKPAGESLYDSRSCNDLYMEAVALEKESFSYAAGNGNRTKVASIVSTVFTPALYYLGYSAYQDYKTEADSKSTFAKIEEIRFRMAEKRCFSK